MGDMETLSAGEKCDISTLALLHLDPSRMTLYIQKRMDEWTETNGIHNPFDFQL